MDYEMSPVTVPNMKLELVLPVGCRLVCAPAFVGGMLFSLTNMWAKDRIVLDGNAKIRFANTCMN